MRLVVNTLALTVTTCLFNIAYAGTTEQQQIQGLRAEIEALKIAIKKQNSVETQSISTSKNPVSISRSVDSLSLPFEMDIKE